MQWKTLVVGVDTEFRPAVTVHGLGADLPFAPGARVQMRVTERNAVGDSTPSTVVEAFVPLSAVT
jgi:hypothetical protein